MKKYTLILALFFCGVSFGQTVNYDDSTINLQLPQKAAYWIGNAIRVNPEWVNRNAPDILKACIGQGLKPDSLFTISIKARFVRYGIEALITSRTQVGVNDYRSILYNQPSIVGYTGLISQISTKVAQGNHTAIYLRQWYDSRLAVFQGHYDEIISSVISWSNN